MKINPKLLKVTLGIFSFFNLTYILFDLIFNVSSNIDVEVRKLSANFTSIVLIIGLLILDILIPIPASIVMVISGILFGGFFGGIISLIGALGGSTINFLISRRLGRQRIKKWLGDEEYHKLSAIMDKYGSYIIILTRIIPLAMESVSSISGLSSVKLKKFIALNLIGFTPTVFFYSFSGALYRNGPQNILLILAIGFFLPLIIWLLVVRFKIKDT